MEKTEMLTLREGESHVVALPGLGSAGYQWLVEAAGAKIVAVEEILHTAEEAGGVRQGSLNQQFRITALAAGKDQIRFVQVRPWARNAPHSVVEVLLTVVSRD
jgi:predicted secreted protein